MEENKTAEVKVIREENDNCKTFKNDCCKHSFSVNHVDTMYGMGFIGALIYFIITATGFVGILLGILKAIF